MCVYSWPMYIQWCINDLNLYSWRGEYFCFEKKQTDQLTSQDLWITEWRTSTVEPYQDHPKNQAQMVLKER